jgi:hypothetical protein
VGKESRLRSLYPAALGRNFNYAAKWGAFP